MMVQDTFQCRCSYPDFTSYLEPSNLRTTHQEPFNQPLAPQPPQAPSDSQYGYTPNLINPWPFPGVWATQNMAWDLASQPLTTEPAIAAPPPVATALYRQSGLGDVCNPQEVFPLLLTSPEQSSYDLLASSSLGVDGVMATPPTQSEIIPPMYWTRPFRTGRDETVGLPTQDERATAERSSQGKYNRTSGPEEGIGSPQKQIGRAVEELCQLEGRLQYLNKQQMSLVNDSFNN